MGKRSNFTRRKHDSYMTPLRAVEPLIPHLPRKPFTFVEPCAGDARLIRHIEQLHSRAYCLGAWDIEPLDHLVDEGDALEVDLDLFEPDFIITNPPWTRAILHPMIERFSAVAPTWLLFDADWMFTKQAGPYLPWLRHVVALPRIKWIEDSPYSAKDNACWFLFDQKSEAPLKFQGVAA